MFWKRTIKELKEQVNVRYKFDLYLVGEISRVEKKLDKKLDLILKELGKEYVPEKDTTEPAKLVDKKVTLYDLKPGSVIKLPKDWNMVSGSFTGEQPNPKNKRKYTKKKK